MEEKFIKWFLKEIPVLTEKGIEESGTHDELMSKNGIYSQLYKWTR